jgi:hypothetical protein
MQDAPAYAAEPETHLLVVQSRTGAVSVHRGSAADVERLARAAKRRGDDLAEGPRALSASELLPAAERAAAAAAVPAGPAAPYQPASDDAQPATGVRARRRAAG